MKIFLALFLTFFLATNAPLHAEAVSPPPSTSTGECGNITVRIAGLKENIGMLGISLYSSNKGFPGDHSKACATAIKKVTGATDEVVFNNLPYGTYAVSVLHDENSNGKLDTTFLIGIPKEGIGVSNNPKARRGPPKYSDCTLTLDSKQLETSISMKYF
jgi:uncharacterized protein (DUF2141 family)